jgi:hypothetical protein
MRMERTVMHIADKSERTLQETSEDARETSEDAPETSEGAHEISEDAHGEQPVDDGDAPVELFPAEQVERFRAEWQEVQTRFVDDPRSAVQGADDLVAAVMKSLAGTFADHKHELEGQWQHGSDVETEDLRRALRRYRSFFNQLLNA